MNIVQAFKKFNGKLIISGLSGSGKTSIAKFIERDFKLVLINIDNFVIEKFDETVELSNNVKVTNWDSVDSFDWDAINKIVNDNKANGIVLCGPYFPLEKIKFESDFHIQIKVPKQILIEKRLKFAESNRDKFKTLETIDNQIISTIVNKITYPLYLKYTEESKIDKFVNSKDITKDQIYDEVAEYLFYKIKENLQKIPNEPKNNRSINNAPTNNTPANNKSQISSDDSNSSDSSDSSDSFGSDDSTVNTVTDTNKYNDSSSSEESGPPVKLSNSEPIFVGSPDDVEVDYWEYPRVGKIKQNKIK